MFDELKVLIKWPNGNILPVLTNKSSKSIDLIRLLRFAYSSNEDIILFFNGNLLNSDIPLGNQFIIDNSIIEAFIVPKPFQHSEQLSPIQSIALEAAKVADKRYNALESQPCRITYTEESSSEDTDYFTDNFEYDTKDKDEKIDSIPSEPLPTFWDESSSEPTTSLSEIQLNSYLNTIEEAGQFFETQGWQ